MTTHDELAESATRIKLDLETDMTRYERKLEDEDGDGQEELEQEYSDTVLAITRNLKQSYNMSGWSTDDVTIDVLLGTGGPAYGVIFSSATEASVWFQDWFTEKCYVPLTEKAAWLLWDIWYLEGITEDLDL